MVRLIKENDASNCREFSRKDVDFIQNLAGDAVTVYRRDNKIFIDLKSTEYIKDGIVNFTNKFYDEVEAYLKSAHPNCTLSMNNFGNVFWLNSFNTGE